MQCQKNEIMHHTVTPYITFLNVGKFEQIHNYWYCKLAPSGWRITISSNDAQQILKIDGIHFYTVKWGE